MVEIERLSKRFRRTSVLSGVDLCIPRGERVALVGANGAGKTTLIRCLLGEYVCEGRVRIAGESPRRRRCEVLGRVGFVPQLPPPLRMPVHELLRFAADLCRSDPAQMVAVAERLGLGVEKLRRNAFVKLSGGQKQKLLIAVALGRPADLLVMDEPAANLDPEARRTFFELLAERPPGTTMLISSHRLDEVAPLAHRVIELDGGDIVLDDRIAESGALTSQLACRVELRESGHSVAQALRAWGFEANADETVFEGGVAGPDRLRFLGLLSRYSGLITALHLDEGEHADA